MDEFLFGAIAFNLAYARKLAEDIPDDQMCGQPVPGRVMNHAAFTLGHLAWAADNGMALLGEERKLADWKDLVGMGAKPVSERSRYPAKAELIEALERAHNRLVEALRQATPQRLAEPAPERMRGRFPTIGHLLVGLISTHEAAHLGQLSAWRRAMGFPPAF